MTAPLVREFRLGGRYGDGRHAYVNEAGAFLGQGVPLLEFDEAGRWQPRKRATLEKLLSIGYGLDCDLGWRMDRLATVARALNKKDIGLAAIALVHAELPPLPDQTRAWSMAKADLFEKYEPDQPRVPAGSPEGGEWGNGGEQNADDGDARSSGDPNFQEAGAKTKDVAAEKNRFVDAHLSDAQAAAKQLGVPVENILGLSALESGWGEGNRFQTVGKNYFGIHYPAPFATGYMLTEDGKTRVATFASYGDSLKSFIAESGHLIQGVSDPATFARILQNAGKYGIDRHGNKEPTYVDDVANTIKGLRPFIARRSA